MFPSFVLQYAIIALGYKRFFQVGILLSILGCLIPVISSSLNGFYLLVFIKGNVHYILPTMICYLCMLNYPELKSLANGIATCCTAFTGTFWSLVIIYFVNPQNVNPILDESHPELGHRYYPKEITDSLPKAF